jgi:type VI protein secretion system component Hcp
VQTPSPVGQISIDGGTPSPIYGFSLGAATPFTWSRTDGGAGTSGRLSFSEVAIAKNADALSTELLRLVATASHRAAAEVQLYQAGTTTPQSTYLLGDVVVTSFQSAGGGAESVALAFSRLTLTTAGTSFCWDVGLNRAC